MSADDVTEFWVNRWTENKLGWHLSIYNPVLLNYGHRFLQPGCRVLVPLCGKSLDLKWLYDLGYTIVGIECSSKAIEDFFTETGLALENENIQGMNVYKTHDGRLRVFCGNIFNLDVTQLGLFDAVWDRGSLVAVYENDRERYAKFIKSLLAPGSRYLLSLIQYEPHEHFSGPPRNVPTSQVQKLFGDVCDMETLEVIDMSNTERVREVWKVDHLEEVVMLLTSKK